MGRRREMHQRKRQCADDQQQRHREQDALEKYIYFRISPCGYLQRMDVEQVFIDARDFVRVEIIDAT